MIRIILVAVIIFSLSQNVHANYNVNENCKNAWMLLMDLEIDKAKELLAEEIIINPENYYAYYLDQTCDAYKLLINSSEAEYETFVENYYKKREIMDGKDEDSPYYLACYSEMELQVGIFNIINGSNFSGLRKAYSAYKNVYRNLEKFPDFRPSLKMDGFFNIAISNLPPFVKWAASFFGISSDLDYGFNVLYDNYEAQKNIRGINAESALYIILSAKLNKTPELVYTFSNSLDSCISQTFLHSYFRANIAYRIEKNEEALRTLQQIDISEHSFGDNIYNYMMGKVLLQKLDSNAEYYLSKYLKGLKKKGYLKEMNYKLALYYLINNDSLEYLKYCEIVRNEGKNIQERDREALYDASLDYFPDINLVKAHLLINGGYFDKFETALNAFEENNSGLFAYQLEYHLLKGRFDASNNNIGAAISEFKKVIEMGEYADYYFASEAALRLGYIFEEIGKAALAKEYYNKSIILYRNDYYEYIEDKAVKGYNSIEP